MSKYNQQSLKQSIRQAAQATMRNMLFVRKEQLALCVSPDADQIQYDKFIQAVDSMSGSVVQDDGNISIQIDDELGKYLALSNGYSIQDYQAGVSKRQETYKTLMKNNIANAVQRAVREMLT